MGEEVKAAGEVEPCLEAITPKNSVATNASTFSLTDLPTDDLNLGEEQQKSIRVNEDAFEGKGVPSQPPPQKES